MHHTNQPLARPEEMRAFIDKEYPELAGGQISTGFLGTRYRVIVKDAATLCTPSTSQSTPFDEPFDQGITADLREGDEAA